jgi:hypothetical protein
MKPLRRAIFALVLGLGLFACSCNTPTLPLPPPSEGSIAASLESDGKTARITGLHKAVEPYALVTCFNNRTGVGVVGLATGEGTFELLVSAEAGDGIEVWQRVGNDPPSVVVDVK